MGNSLIVFLSMLIGPVIGVITMAVISKAGLNKDQQEASMLLKEMEIETDSMVKQTVLDDRTQVHELKIAAGKEIKECKQEVTDMENKLLRGEDNLNFHDETLTNKEKQIDAKSVQLTGKMAVLDKKDKELQEKIDVQVKELEHIASPTTAEAKEELMAIIEKRIEKETIACIKEEEEETKSIAGEKTRDIVVLNIQRISLDEVVDRTVSVVSLSGEETRGRIIGREGRNIKTIEQATGVGLIIGDIPETITVSCSNPVWREVTGLALEHLIKGGRTQPGRIEEVVHKIKREMDTSIMKTGEDAVFKFDIGRIDREIIRPIGRLKYCFSYGQNTLQHNMEIVHLAGMIAAGLGLNQQLTKCTGFLHNIGEALDFKVGGSHVELGYKFCKKYRKHRVVLSAIQSHHGEVEPQFLIFSSVVAADMISTVRPGACYEALQSYTSHLGELERITKSSDGVDSIYATQAGREVRAVAVPRKMDDLGCHKLTRDIKDKTETGPAYPGQIKVTAICETRACELAK